MLVSFGSHRLLANQIPATFGFRRTSAAPHRTTTMSRRFDTMSFEIQLDTLLDKLVVAHYAYNMSYKNEPFIM